MEEKIDILNALDERFDASENLTPNQRKFLLISKFDREIQYGGFDQYYYSIYGGFSKETEEALKELKAFDVGQILSEANAVWPHSIPEDQDERIDALDTFSEADREKFLNLETRYSNTTDNLIEILYIFTNTHSNEFQIQK